MLTPYIFLCNIWAFNCSTIFHIMLCLVRWPLLIFVLQHSARVSDLGLGWANDGRITSIRSLPPNESLTTAGSDLSLPDGLRNQPEFKETCAITLRQQYSSCYLTQGGRVAF